MCRPRLRTWPKKSVTLLAETWNHGFTVCLEEACRSHRYPGIKEIQQIVKSRDVESKVFGSVEWFLWTGCVYTFWGWLTLSYTSHRKYIKRQQVQQNTTYLTPKSWESAPHFGFHVPFPHWETKVLMGSAATISSRNWHVVITTYDWLDWSMMIYQIHWGSSSISTIVCTKVKLSALQRFARWEARGSKISLGDSIVPSTIHAACGLARGPARVILGKPEVGAGGWGSWTFDNLCMDRKKINPDSHFIIRLFILFDTSLQHSVVH